MSRVLVVEDDWLIAMDLCSLLTQFGCTVVGPGRTVEGSLQLIDDNTIDAALVDVNLGSEVSHPIAVRLEEMKIPFAFLSGYSPLDLDPRWQNNRIIAKPFDETGVLRMLREFGITEAHNG